METVKVSYKYQIVIPAKIRKSLNIKAGQKVRLIEFNNHIEIVPMRDVASMRGFVKGIDTSFNREADHV